MVGIYNQSGGILILKELKTIGKKMYTNSKLAFKSLRKFQDALRKEFPGLVENKGNKNVEVKKDDRGRIQEVYERRVKYYKDD